MNIITSLFGGLSFEWNNNHNILFLNHKNKNPGLKTSTYSNLETGLKLVLFNVAIPLEWFLSVFVS